MAKIVIAGHADCPYLARAELLGDKLSTNLPDFKLHKIVKTPEEWQKWLTGTCQEKGWVHKKSPIVWRELIDRGGKGVLIGDANEFQEYAKGYYGIESGMVSDDMRKIGQENLQCKVQVDRLDADFRALSKPVHVCITNASSGVCYGMLDALLRGEVLGKNTEMIVHLFDGADKKESLDGMKMEAQDLAYGLLRGVVVESNPRVAFKDCEVIVMLDEIKSDKGQDELIKAYATLFTNYATIINEVAKKNVKVLVAGSGPVNFNAYMMIKNAPTIPRQNFAALPRLVENHSKAIIAERLKVNSAGVVDVIVWGNPNGQHYIDVERSRVHKYDGAIIGPDSFSVSGPEMVFDAKWLQTEFLELVKTKREREEAAMKHPATTAQASAINSALHQWMNGSPSGQMFSMGVCSDGWYGIPKDLVFSFPVTFHPKGYWNVVQDIDLSEEVKTKIHETIKDLESEIEVLFPKPKPPTPEASSDSGTDGEKKEGDEQRLETIIEEKKETTDNDSEGTKTDTAGSKSGSETAKADGEGAAKSDADSAKSDADSAKTDGEGAAKSDAEGKTDTEGEKSEAEKTEEGKEASGAEDQLPAAE